MRREAIVYLVLFAISYLSLFLCFSPVIWFESAHHDNTRYFRGGKSDAIKSDCQNDGEYSWLYGIGRPITAEIECQVFKNTRQFEDLKKMRAEVIIFIAASAAVLGLILKRLGVEYLTALVISIAIFTLPGMQNTAFMTNFPNAICPLLSLIAFLIMMPVRHLWPWRCAKLELARLFLSFILLICTALMYPVLSFVFFFGGAARTSKNPTSKWRINAELFFRDLLLFGGAMICGLVLSNLLAPSEFRNHIVPIPKNYQMDCSLINVAGKISIILSEAIPRASNLWFMQNGTFGFALLFAISISVLYLVFFACSASGFCNKNFVNMIILLCFILLPFFPIILSKAPILHQRLLFPGMGVLLILAAILIPYSICCLHSALARIGLYIERIFTTAILSLGLIMGNYTLSKSSWNTNLEMMFVRTELAKLDKLPRRIHLIRAIDNNTGFNGLPSHSDEFHRKTTDFKQDIVDFMQLSLFGSSPEEGIPLSFCDPMTTNCEMVIPKNNKIISFSDYGKKFCKTDDMALIDMNILIRATGTGDPNICTLSEVPYCDKPKFRIYTSSKSEDNYGIEKAFDNSIEPSNFWETSISKPVEIDIYYRESVLLQNYSLSAGECANRMPISWSLFGSNDSNDWKLLDYHRNTAAWEQYEKRTFKIEQLGPFKQLRFVFTKSLMDILRIYEIMIKEC